MNWACAQPCGAPVSQSCGVRSTRLSWLAHRLYGPSAAPGATSKGSSQDTLAASAVASTSGTCGDISTGNVLIIPPVLRRAQSSSAAWPVSAPVSTARGSPASHRSSPSVLVAPRRQTPAAAATAGCGAHSRAPAIAAA